jgi:hypothetical protein
MKRSIVFLTVVFSIFNINDGGIQELSGVDAGTMPSRFETAAKGGEGCFYLKRSYAATGVNHKQRILIGALRWFH